MPESREFYWSKIARQIGRIEAANGQALPTPSISFQFLRRVLFPFTGLVLLALALLVLKPSVWHPPGSSMQVACVDSSMMTYCNYESGATLVWLSFPAENGLAHGDAAGSIN